MGPIAASASVQAARAQVEQAWAKAERMSVPASAVAEVPRVAPAARQEPQPRGEPAFLAVQHPAAVVSVQVPVRRAVAAPAASVVADLVGLGLAREALGRAEQAQGVVVVPEQVQVGAVVPAAAAANGNTIILGRRLHAVRPTRSNDLPVALLGG